MTENEIKEVLKCCGKDPYGCNENCPLYDDFDCDGDSFCIQKIMRSALSLIERQKAEIKRLTAENDELKEYYTNATKASIQYSSENNKLKAEIGELNIELKAMREAANSYKAEIERLNNSNPSNKYANCVSVSNGLIYTHTLDDYEKLIADISNEGIKEFVELLKKKSVYAHGFGFAVALNKIEEALYEWSVNSHG